MLYGIVPVAVSSFLPLLHPRAFKDVGLVYARDKFRDFVFVRAVDLVLLGVVLLPCEVAGIGDDILVGGVAQGGDEGGLCCHPFGVGYYGHVRR